MSGCAASARSRGSSVRNAPIAVSFQSPTTSSAGTCPARDPEGSRSSPASIRCCWMRRASSWPSTSTRPAGSDDASRVPRERAAAWNVPAALERSRSGQGGHVWFFFEEAIPAALARRLGSHLLTETMEGRPDIGLDSYDRLFPNQDTMPQGGFGNLIALPLQKRRTRAGQQRLPRRRLRSVARSVGVSRERAQDRPSAGRRHRRRTPSAADASSAFGCHRRTTETRSRGRRRLRDGRKEPPIVGELPQTSGAGSRQPDLHRQGRTASAAPKPAASPGGVSESRVLQGAGDAAVHLRQAARHRVRRGSPASHRPAARMPRRCSPDADRPGHSARPFATSATQGRPSGRDLSRRAAARTEGGRRRACWRTTPACWPPRRRSARRSSLPGSSHSAASTRWCSCIAANCSTNGSSGCRRSSACRRKSIGRIGGGRNATDRRCSTSPSFRAWSGRASSMTASADYGHLIVDECHHLSAHSFEQVARQAKARFVIGLSATVARKDGHHPIIFMQCGPVRHRVNAKAQAAARPFEHYVARAADRVPADRERLMPTSGSSFKPSIRNWSTTKRAIVASARTSSSRVHNGRSPLVLTERNDHLDRLERRTRGQVSATWSSCGRGWARSSGRPWPIGSRPSRAMRRASSWRPASTSARDSMIRGWTRCS